jgi:hypothetical protein
MIEVLCFICSSSAAITVFSLSALRRSSISCRMSCTEAIMMLTWSVVKLPCLCTRARSWFMLFLIFARRCLSVTRCFFLRVFRLLTVIESLSEPNSLLLVQRMLSASRTEAKPELDRWLCPKLPGSEMDEADVLLLLLAADELSMGGEVRDDAA